MTNGNDPVLQALFDSARDDLLENGFTQQVMSEVEKKRRRTIIVWVGLSLLALVVVWWLAEPVLELLNLVSALLPTSLFDLGEGWIAVFLAPLNSIATLIAAGAFGLYAGFRKLFS